MNHKDIRSTKKLKVLDDVEKSRSKSAQSTARKIKSQSNTDQSPTQNVAENQLKVSLPTLKHQRRSILK